MSAPVVGFTADVPKGLLGRETLIEIEPDEGNIEITITWPYAKEFSTRHMIVTHDEARQIIAGLASVIE